MIDLVAPRPQRFQGGLFEGPLNIPTAAQPLCVTCCPEVIVLPRTKFDVLPRIGQIISKILALSMTEGAHVMGILMTSTSG